MGGAAFTALDFGASKIACLIAAGRSAGDPQLIDLLGVGRAPMRGGGPADPEGHARLVAAALDQARRVAGDAATQVGVAYGGPDLQSRILPGEARLRRGVVGPADVAAAIGAASESLPLEQRRVLHAAPVSYRIDGGASVADPRGMAGATLIADVCVAHAPAAAVAALEQTLERAGARPAFVVAAPFAAGHGVLTAEERDTGAIVLDLGDQSVGIGVFRGGGLVHAETVQGCGARLTRDLAARLKTTPAVAERAKLLYGSLGGEHDLAEALEVPVIGPEGRLEPGLVLRSAFQEALLPRMEEILVRLRGRLTALGDRADGLGVALTGGVSQTPGLRPLAQKILQRPVRLAVPAGVAGLDGGEAGLAVCAGLIRCGLSRFGPARAAPDTEPAVRPAPVRPERVAEEPQRKSPSGPAPLQRSVGEALAWIKENF